MIRGASWEGGNDCSQRCAPAKEDCSGDSPMSRRRGRRVTLQRCNGSAMVRGVDMRERRGNCYLTTFSDEAVRAAPQRIMYRVQDSCAEGCAACAKLAARQ